MHILVLIILNWCQRLFLRLFDCGWQLHFQRELEMSRRRYGYRPMCIYERSCVWQNIEENSETRYEIRKRFCYSFLSRQRSIHQSLILSNARGERNGAQGEMERLLVPEAPKTDSVKGIRPDGYCPYTVFAKRRLLSWLTELVRTAAAAAALIPMCS